jgi:hypothetical protein
VVSQTAADRRVQPGILGDGEDGPRRRVPRRRLRGRAPRSAALRHAQAGAIPRLPKQNPDGYDRSSTITGAASLTRPLLLIHGMANDNVVVAHTLRMSPALLAAGRLVRTSHFVNQRQTLG